MMKQKLLGLTALACVGLSVETTQAGMFWPSRTGAEIRSGISVMTPSAHLEVNCAGNNVGCAMDIPYAATVWIDPALAAITLIDYAVSRTQGERTIDAKDAIKQLEEALGGGSGGSSSGSGNTSGNTSTAAPFTADMIMAQIEVTKVSGEKMFEQTREAVKEYLFETPAPDIKGECTQSDKDCAVARQNEWLLASVTLASATADKVLNQTAKKNVKDGQTEAEKAEEEQKEGDTETTGGGATTLTGHFQKLASNFNAETSPTGLYNKMADIVLDTHRQINDANALFGRDLEAQGLRVITETGPVLFKETEE
ncbi:MAG: hypothetical protein ACI4OR_00140 [Alphaproteobacteria bacterium]